MLWCDQAFSQSQQVDRVGTLTVGVARYLKNLPTISAGNLETLEQRIGNKNRCGARCKRRRTRCIAWPGLLNARTRAERVPS
jgi:hypothetical protein